MSGRLPQPGRFGRREPGNAAGQGPWTARAMVGEERGFRVVKQAAFGAAELRSALGELMRLLASAGTDRLSLPCRVDASHGGDDVGAVRAGVCLETHDNPFAPRERYRIVFSMEMPQGNQAWRVLAAGDGQGVQARLAELARHPASLDFLPDLYRGALGE